MKGPRFGPAAEKVVYRVAGLPVAVRGLRNGRSDPLHATYVRTYWHPRGPAQWSQLALAIVIWPIVVLGASAWSTARNGRVIRSRTGKSAVAQFGEQIRLYFAAGVLAPWYYIFALYEDGRSAPDFIQRFESKSCYIPLLKVKARSPLSDKKQFSTYCGERQIRCVETLQYLDGRDSGEVLPDRDLFVKPSGGRGGRGAERWDRVAAGVFANARGERLSGRDLRKRLVARSRRRPLLIQPRLQAHPALSTLTVGALPTVRVLTCLDERLAPEIIAAIFRTSVGRNVTVDNLHAGGIAALVDLDSGLLSASSNLGASARLGWLSDHPDTGARIEGFALPFWPELTSLAIRAHSHFADRVVIGWDIAIAPDGPIVVEGNGNPDLDIVQRFMRAGVREQRLGRLMGYHLESRRSLTH